MRTILLSITSSLALVGCAMTPSETERQSLGPTAPSALQPGMITSVTTLQYGSTPTLTGEWSWSRVENVRMPYELADMIPNVDPEGPMTQARCEGSGTMMLTQTGTTFSGTAAQSLNQCVTQGGQQFTPPGSDLLIMVDGRIRGASIQFSFANAFLTPCPHAGVISVVEDGLAQTLTATGRCFVPGHPQSESPIPADPPLSGSKTLNWEAVRLQP
jgi:hypothetical protein